MKAARFTSDELNARVLRDLAGTLVIHPSKIARKRIK
jgi:hypothetical protein